MPDFQEILKSYGADYTQTMERFLGSESFYLRMLGMLPDDESCAQLGRALDEGNLEDAFRAAHTLKGVAGNLGLKPLYEAVCQIVEPLRRREASDRYDAMYRTVREEVRRAEQLYRDLTQGV